MRIREHTSKIVLAHISEKKTIMNAAVNNAIKRSLIAESIIYNSTWVTNMNFQYLKSYAMFKQF